ncbi:MAG: GNAT family N-acetyltransferase [Actinobacteria bacterium]|nr:GNAT family N-acetyltransferase [Actinomycetota bacterium]
MTVSIRRLGPGDEELLAAIAGEADDFDLPGASAPEEPLDHAQAVAYLTDPAVLHVHWVAEEDGLLVGELLCHVLRLPSAAGRELLLYSIGVRSAYRRRGIGTALMREMLGWARREGIEVVWVVADNAGAAAFYVACGFEPGEEGRDAVYLQRRVVREGIGP